MVTPALPTFLARDRVPFAPRAEALRGEDPLPDVRGRALRALGHLDRPLPPRPAPPPRAPRLRVPALQRVAPHVAAQAALTTPARPRSRTGCRRDRGTRPCAPRCRRSRPSSARSRDRRSRRPAPEIRHEQRQPPAAGVVLVDDHVHVPPFLQRPHGLGVVGIEARLCPEHPRVPLPRLLQVTDGHAGEQIHALASLVSGEPLVEPRHLIGAVRAGREPPIRSRAA